MVNLQQKAQVFLDAVKSGEDSRVDQVVFLLCQIFNVTPLVVLDKVKEIASDCSSRR